MTDMFTSLCQDTSKNNSINMNIQTGPPQDSLYPAPTKNYGKVAQDSIPEDTTNKLSKVNKNSSKRWWKHILLLQGCQRQSSHGSQHYCCQIIKWYRFTIVQCTQMRKSAIKIKYDTHYSL